MKISSASKKVLASALSAAMVVAFAPTVAFGASSDHGAYVEGTTVLDGTVASYQATSGGKLVTWSYTESLSGSAVQALNDALNDATGVVVLHQDITGNIVVPKDKTVTLDLNGHTITNDSDAAKAKPVVTIQSNGQLTVKGGTLTASTAEGANRAVIGNTDVSSAGKLVVKSGTFNGTVDTDVVSIDDGTFNGTVTDQDAGLSVKNATIEVSSSKDDVTALKLNSAGATRGILTVSGALTVKAEASKNEKKATAVDANVATSGDKAVVNISAATTGAQTSANKVDATAIAGGLAVSGKSTADVTATAKDDTAIATAVNGAFDGKANLTATVAGEYDVTNAVAINGGVTTAITGGKFVGKLVGLSSNEIKAGTFTADPKTYVDSDKYTVIDDGTYYTVYAKTAGTSAIVDGTLTNWFDASVTAPTTTIADAFNQVIDLVANDKAASNLVYAEGKTAADLKALIASGKASYVVTVAQYKEKVATDAEKANFAAIEAFVKGKKSAITNPTTKVFSYSIAITDDAAQDKRVTYGYLTDLGTTARGEARTLTLDATKFPAPDKAAVASKGAGIAIANNGVAADQELTAGRDGQLDHKISATGMFAGYELSLAEIGEGETPAPAPEKATQGIDVSKKSKTVKLAKGKTKTQKAVSFKLGASAETALTIAKKSGNSKISVSGQKITLKKGTKKGTYTAKVSLKAAGSDEFLAAAKTITVKFVVKK